MIHQIWKADFKLSLDVGNVKESNLPKRRTFFRCCMMPFAIIGVISMICVLLLGSVYVFRKLGGCLDQASISEFESPGLISQFHMEPPPSAQSICIDSCYSLQGGICKVRFQISPDDVGDLLATTLVSELRVSDAGYPPEWDLDWPNNYFTEHVKPNSSALYGVYESSSDRGSTEQRIVIDISDPDTYKVYVVTAVG